MTPAFPNNFSLASLPQAPWTSLCNTWVCLPPRLFRLLWARPCLTHGTWLPCGLCLFPCFSATRLLGKTEGDCNRGQNHSSGLPAHVLFQPRFWVCPLPGLVSPQWHLEPAFLLCRWAWHPVPGTSSCVLSAASKPFMCSVVSESPKEGEGSLRMSPCQRWRQPLSSFVQLFTSGRNKIIFFSWVPVKYCFSGKITLWPILEQLVKKDFCTWSLCSVQW